MATALLQLNRIWQNYGEHSVLKDLSFTLHKGEIGCLLGPSGCGKTTALRCIAGFESISSGEILVNGNCISSAKSSVPPEKRQIGMVFQDYALFPHLDVAANIGFGLHRLPRNVRSQRVSEWLSIVQLEKAAGKYPHELSGGQQQRVALARALVTRPQVLLFDEPLGALDAKLRVKVREEIRRIQQRAGITTLYVTHDQEEALSISDRIAVMNGGKVIQMGTPEDLYLRPQSRFLADFIGLTNIFPGKAASGAVELEGLALKTAGELPPGGTEVSVAVRPDALRILNEGESAPNVLEARVTLRMFLGTVIKYEMSAGPRTWTVAAPQQASRREYDPGETVKLGCEPSDVLVLRD